MSAQQQPGGQVVPPLMPTSARWFNRRCRARDLRGEWQDKWRKVLAHSGSYEQFAYGTDTPSGRRREQLQWCIICSPWSRVIAVDVDDEDAYMGTRTARHVRREHAISTRGSGYHALIDCRAVPPGDWPRQRPIAGADIKSCGFIPVPGSEHYSDEKYERILHDGQPCIVPATRALIAAITADQDEHREKSRLAGGGNGHGGGNGGGHDGEVAAQVMSMILRGLTREQCYAGWLEIAIPRDPGWPFTGDDFERHYRSALAKVRKIRAEEKLVLARWLAHMDTPLGGAR